MYWLDTRKDYFQLVIFLNDYVQFYEDKLMGFLDSVIKDSGNEFAGLLVKDSCR